MQVAVDQGQVSIMWIIDGNTFVGKGSQIGTFSQVSLFEISIQDSYSVTEIAGGGTGSKAEIAGGGTGTQIAGGGTGTTIQIAGGGTGNENLFITLPNGTGLEIEVALGCNTATVSVLDSVDYSEIITFNKVRVMGNTGLCQSNDGEFSFRLNENRNR